VDAPGKVDVDEEKRFRGGLVFKAHRLLYHSTLGLRVIRRTGRRRSGCAKRRSASDFSSYTSILGDI